MPRGQQQRQPGDRCQADSQGEAAEGGDRRDVDRAQPGRDVEAEADCRAGEDGEAQRVAEGIGDEGSKEDPRVGNRAPQIAQRQYLVGRQQPVTERGEQQRRQNLPLRDRVQMREHALDVQPCQLVVQDESHQRQDQQRRERPDPAPEGAFLALRGGRCRWHGQVRRRSAT
jgi:hypothetical protein